MSETAPIGEADAPTPDADLQSAFALSIREAVERLSRITEEERASNTAIERAARAALQLLRAAAEAHGLARRKKKDDQEDGNSVDARALTVADFQQALSDLREDDARERSGSAETDSAGGEDQSASCGGDLV